MKRTTKKIKLKLYKLIAWIRSKAKTNELYPDLRCGIRSTEWVDGTRDEYLRATPKNLNQTIRH